MKDKNKYGQYFTIDAIAAFMVGLIKHGLEARVLEPSCGRGVFLHKLEDAGFSKIDAFEIDNTLNNPFEYVRYESFISSPLDPYDVVIGNPPYIRWKNLEPEMKTELESSALWNRYFNSLCDYLFIFILKSIEQLVDGGELIFICTEYWMNTTHSISLRNYMMQHGFFSEIYHFKEAPLFEGVSASFIIFRYVKSNELMPNIDLYRYTRDDEPSFSELSSLSCFRKEVIPQFSIDKRWLLATKSQQASLESFEARCAKNAKSLFSEQELYRIGDYCDIGNGTVSGLDKAFNITLVSPLNERENNSTIKVLKAKDLGFYKSKSESRYFFIRERITEEEFSSQMPHVYNHMVEYKEGLENRYNYGKDIRYWEFVFPRNLNLFLRPEKRIFVPCKERVSNKSHFRFVLVSSDYFPLQDVTGILPKPSCHESVEYVTAYLNNPRVFEWLGFNGIVKGYIVEFSEAPIASIPYRPINWRDSAQVALHDRITESVRKYMETSDESYLQVINHCFNILFL